MSRITLNTNLPSLNAQRNLFAATAKLQTSFSRLSSGMRINRAADDAAGLAVASLLSTDSRIFQQGIRNFNDGISYLNIAESTLGEMSNIILRIGEIAEQSANGTLSQTQRAPLQSEVSALQNEFNRLLNSTKFNGTQLLTGSNTLVKLQGGYGEQGALFTQIGKALVSDAFGDLAAGNTLRVSTSATGVEADASSSEVKLSADGMTMVFASTATNLISGVSGNQIYAKNLQTGALTLVTSDSAGVTSNGSSLSPQISADGRYVAFRSNATNLITGVSGFHVYVKDLYTGALSLGSSNSSGTAATTGASSPSISADGSFLSFVSSATNLVSGVSGTQVYYKNLLTGEVQLVSSSSLGVAGNGSSNAASMSADGRYLAFSSAATNLISGVGANQIYLKDMLTGQLTLASSSSSGVAANGTATSGPVLSADGKFVAFTATNATSLISGVSGFKAYLKNLETGELKLVSSSSSGVASNATTTSNTMSISADGRFVTFAHSASNLISGVSGGHAYIKDNITGELRLLDRSDDGNLGDGYIVASFGMSADGRYVAFMSNDTNLIAEGTNGSVQVFLRDTSKAGAQELNGILVSNQASSRVTLTMTDRYLEELNLYRGTIGAASSRISTAISTLSTTTENLESAAAQIRDTDIAEESARLAATRILQQSAAAVLAQANKQPELALVLLRDT